MNVNPDHYTYKVNWSPEDDMYVATVVELPSVSWLAGSKAEAVDGLDQVVREVVLDMIESGETPPQPLATKRYSGRFMVRLTPEAHRRLVIDAAEHNVSLNRLVSDRLTS